MQSLNIYSETISIKSNRIVSIKIPTIDDLDVASAEQTSQLSLSDQICQYLIKDPDNFLKNICLHNDLQANFQTIALAKLSGKSLIEIAEKFNVDLETLSNFFQDCCCYYANLLENKL